MSRDLVNKICAEMPGAVLSDPTQELDSWKVGGKMFTCFGERIDGFCVKTDSVETAHMLIDAGAATKAPYFHSSWVLISMESDADELRHRIKTSYDIVKGGLPKKVQAALDQS